MISIPAITFYIFSGFLLVCASLVVTSRNTVHSVLFLILAFFNAAGLFILANAEFLAMMLVVVYVGAVAVLFLFVVMMLNVNISRAAKGFKSYLFVGGIVAAMLLGELVLIAGVWTIAPEASDLTAAPHIFHEGSTNTQALGNLLYTHYVLIFQGSGLILLVAMIGAIVLTLRHREGVKRQTIHDQLKRNPEDTLELVDVPVGKGVSR